MYIELKSNQQLIKVYYAQFAKLETFTKMITTFSLLQLQKRQNPFWKAYINGNLGQISHFEKFGFFGGFSSRNPKVSIFRDFSNFLRRRFHALGMDLEYFLLQINYS